MAIGRQVALLLSAAVLRVRGQGANVRNGDPLPAGKPFTPEVKEGLFKSYATEHEWSIVWVLALDWGHCTHACGELECSEDMFAKVNSQHAFSAVLESIDNAPGCGEYKVDTEYGVAPFIWEDGAQCWVSGVDKSGEETGTTCGQLPDPQFTDVRLCPCRKERGKKVAKEATDAVESSPADEDAALQLGKEQALEGLHEVSSAVPAAAKGSSSRPLLVAATLATVVGTAGLLGVTWLRASRREASSRLLCAGENPEDSCAAQSEDC